MALTKTDLIAGLRPLGVADSALAWMWRTLQQEGVIPKTKAGRGAKIELRDATTLLLAALASDPLSATAYRRLVCVPSDTTALPPSLKGIAGKGLRFGDALQALLTAFMTGEATADLRRLALNNITDEEAAEIAKDGPDARRKAYEATDRVIRLGQAGFRLRLAGPTSSARIWQFSRDEGGDTNTDWSVWFRPDVEELEFESGTVPTDRQWSFACSHHTLATLGLALGR